MGWLDRLLGRKKQRRAASANEPPAGPPSPVPELPTVFREVLECLEPRPATIRPLDLLRSAHDDNFDDREVAPLCGLRPAKGLYRKRAGELLERFPAATRTLIAATAARLVLESWERYPAALRASGDWQLLSHLDDTAPRGAIHEVERLLAGVGDEARRREVLELCGPLVDATIDYQADYGCVGACSAASAAEYVLVSTMPAGTWQSSPDELQWETVSHMVQTLGDRFDDESPVMRDQLIRRWWSACTRRLAFSDVFAAEIELGEPPEPWPGDDPAHLARVAAWEAMSDDDRQGMIERHRRRHKNDRLALRSGRTIERA